MLIYSLLTLKTDVKCARRFFTLSFNCYYDLEDNPLIPTVNITGSVLTPTVSVACSRVVGCATSCAVRRKQLLIFPKGMDSYSETVAETGEERAGAGALQ